MPDFNYNAEKSKAAAARREMLARAKHVYDTRVAAAQLDLEAHTLERQQQLQAWLEQQVVLLRQQVEATLRSEYAEPYQSYDTALRMAQEMYDMDVEQADAVLADFNAAAAAARAAAKQARWLASPAGQKLERDRAEQLRRETIEYEEALARGLWPSHWCRWWVEAELAMGVPPAQAEQDYVRTAAWRAQYLQRWPDQHAAVEGVDRAPWDALASVRRP